MPSKPFEQLPDPPEVYRGHTVLVRLVDGLGFRFRWAVEGLRETDRDFSPGHDAMTIGALVDHIRELVLMVRDAFRLDVAASGTADEQTLQHLWAIREALTSLDDRELETLEIRKHPLWYAVNGPLADALTHVGQINLLRRLNGNPCPRVSVFRGRAD